MTVGTDTYVSVACADAYITSHYRGNNANRVRWMTLSDEDKVILLVAACTEIDALPFVGRKASRDQQLAFPRLPLQYGRTQEPPADIKAAQIELALWMSDDSKQADAEQRQNLQAQGVKQFSVGDLSETYETGKATHTALLCPKAAQLLKPYLCGGFALC